MSLWLDYIKIYMEYQEGKEFDNIETVVEYINGFTENPNNYVSNFDNLYFRGIPREKVYTGFEPVIKAIGVAALFVLVGVILYFILFHLKWIRNFVKRFSKKAEPERKVPNKMPKEQIVISKNSVKKEPKALDTPKEEVVEEPIVEAPVEETPSNEDDSTEEETPVLDTKEETEENE